MEEPRRGQEMVLQGQGGRTKDDSRAASPDRGDEASQCFDKN